MIEYVFRDKGHAKTVYKECKTVITNYQTIKKQNLGLSVIDYLIR